MLLIVLVVGVTAAMFAQQIMSFYNTAQLRQISASFQELIDELNMAHRRDYVRIAREFSERNQSYSFVMQDSRGRVVFASVNIMDFVDQQSQRLNIMLSAGRGYTISASVSPFADEDLSQLISTLFVGAFVLITLCIVAAAQFARQMTQPIKLLVADAVAMSRLEPVSQPEPRSDEIGTLSQIVHEMYGKLKDNIADLEEEKDAQRYFFAAASHELKTPIAATSALLQGMLDNIGDYQDHPKYLWECLKMANEQNKIINEILEIVKLTDGKIAPSFEAVDLRALTDDILPRYQTLVDKKELTLHVQIPDGIRCTADVAMLGRALSNVIINAVQNTPEQGEIRICAEPTGECIRLYVLNTGARIDEDVLPKLFDPFFRVDTARTQSGRSGLGLTIVAKTLECMGCAFGLENADDGVMFWVDMQA